jgi:tol-pal system protein YbgF
MRRALVGILALTGCGGAASQAELRDLKARLAAAEQARVEISRKLEELDNRVFLLTDQVESQKVALGQRGGEPKLPVVTLAPPPTGPRETVIGGPPPPEPEPEPPTTIARDPRPTITLSGSTTPWLEPEGDGASGSHAAQRSTRSRSGMSSPVVARRPRSPSPPPEQGLGVTHGKPPLVDQVVAGSAAPVVPAAAPSSPSAAPPVEDPTTVYRAAYAKLKGGQPAAAADDFRSFVARFPTHDLADNAQYWLGETYYSRGDFADAAPEFRAVIRRWPSGNKAPDALLKLGYCMLAQGEAAAGQKTLQQVVEHYPRTDAATLAQKRLGELPTEATR